MVIKKDFSVGALKKMHVEDLRKLCRERGMSGVWLASARKPVLIKAWIVGHGPNVDEQSPEDLADDKIVLLIREFAEVFAEMAYDVLKKKLPRP